MASEPYSKRLLATLVQSPQAKLTFDIEKETVRNAARCMTALLCNRLAASGVAPERAAGTTYHWDDGIINFRNAVKSLLWTNLRLNLVNDFHALAADRP